MEQAVAQDPALSTLQPEQQQRTAAYFEALEQLGQAQQAVDEIEQGQEAWKRQQRSIPLSMRGSNPKLVAAEAALAEAKKRKEQAWSKMPSEAQAELIRRGMSAYETRL